MLFNGDCLEVMKTLEDKSIDLVFCDLPYGQTSCKWDCKIDLVEFWKQIMRIKKLNTPIFFTTTTKFGVELIQSAPKKCFFRYDLVWVKSAPAGFLCAKKMPMRKHEMIYVFYEKLPFYDLSRHTHKFLKKEEVIKKVKRDSTYGKIETHDLKTGKNNAVPRYDPPLPVSVVKEEGCYGEKVSNSEAKYGQKCAQQYDPPLPVSVVKEDTGGATGKEDIYGNPNRDIEDYKKCGKKGKNQVLYDPPLPVSVVKEDKHTLYGEVKELGIPHTSTYDPPLPVSVVKEEYNTKEGIIYNGGNPLPINDYSSSGRKGSESAYDPPLPTTMLEIKSTRGKHSTEKPVALMEWVLSYYSKEGDIILDPTMGSGSTGVACKNLNRKFIGIEMDAEIFEVAKSRNPDEPVMKNQ